MRRTVLLAILTALLTFLIPFTVLAGLGDGPPFRLYTQEPSGDYSVWRTVNTLSCHPQYPHVPEVPLFTAVTPDHTACFSWHAVDSPHVTGVDVGHGKVGAPGARAPVARRHYVVVEGTNRTPSTAFPGAYWHFEGVLDVFQIAVSESQQQEVWYLKELGSGTSRHQIGQDRIGIRRVPFIDLDGNTQLGSVMIGDGLVNWKSCASSGTRRKGDEGIPCFTITVGGGDKAYQGRTWLNPWMHDDIPHDRFGVRSRDQIWDARWAYDRRDSNGDHCYPEVVPVPTWIDDARDGIFNSHEAKLAPTSRVYPVTPPGCDFPPLPADPGAPPRQGYPDGVIPVPGEATTTPTASPTLVIGDATPTVTPTPFLTATPYPTETPRVTPTPIPGGYEGEYFDNPDWSGEPVVVRVDPSIDFWWGDGAPADTPFPRDYFSVRWTGFVPEGVTQLRVRSDDGVEVEMNGALVLDRLANPPYSSVYIPARPRDRITVRYRELSGDAYIAVVSAP